MVLDLPRAIHMLLYNTNYDADEGKRQDELLSWLDAHEDDYERNELTDGSDPWRLALTTLDSALRCVSAAILSAARPISAEVVSD